jgi:hypothetical protein
VIGREDVEALLLSACPSFESSPDRLEYDKDFGEEAEPQVYLLAGVFVRHLTALNGAGRREEFPAVFDVIEELHIRGDKYVRDLASIGFLEDLQNTNLHPANSRPEDFIPYLRPVSRWWWEEVELFWDGKVNPIGSSGRPYPPRVGPGHGS